MKGRWGTTFISVASQIQKSFVLPGGPVVKAPGVHCRGCGFDPWSGELGSYMLHGSPRPKKKKTQKKISIRYKLLQKIEEDETSPNLFTGNYIQYPVRNEIFPAVPVNKDVTVTSNCGHNGW